MYGYGYKYTASGSIGSNVNQNWSPDKEIAGESVSVWLKERIGNKIADTVTPGTGDATIFPATTTVESNMSATTNQDAVANTIWVLRGRLTATTASRIQGASVTGQNTRFYLGTDAASKWRFGYGDQSGLSSPAGAADTNWHTFLMYDKRMWVLAADIDISNANLLNIIATVTPDVNHSTAAFSGTVGKISYCTAATIYIRFEFALSYIGTITAGIITWANKHVFRGKILIDDLLSDSNSIVWNTAPTESYSIYGNRSMMELGYSLYEDPKSGDKSYIPALESGFTTRDIAGYYKICDVAGSSSKYNFAKAYISIPAWDRSNTGAWNDACRSSAYYLSGNPTYWHSSELNKSTIALYAIEAGNKFINNVEFEIITFPTAKTGSDLQKILKYVFGNFNISYPITGSDAHIEWKISDNPLLHLSGNNVFTFNPEQNLLLYSVDSGINYNRLEFPDAKHINMFHIFKNGTLMFATRTKIYKSTDNLLTISEITVKDTDGSDYAFHTPEDAKYPGLYFINTMCFTSVDIDGDEIYVFGNYTNSVYLNGVAPANLYYSINGEGVKLAYKFGRNGYYRDDGTEDGNSAGVGNVIGDIDNTVMSRHTHAVTYNPDLNKWYMCSGDFHRTEFEEIHWFEGTYNPTTDVWSWSVILDALPATRYKSGSLVYHNGYIYFTDDSVTSAEHGLYKTLPEDIETYANHVKICSFDNTAAQMFINESNELIGKSAIEGVNGFVFTSKNLTDVNVSLIDNLPANYKMLGKLDVGGGGYYKLTLLDSSKYMGYMYRFSKALLIKIK